MLRSSLQERPPTRRPLLRRPLRLAAFASTCDISARHSTAALRAHLRRNTHTTVSHRIGLQATELLWS